MDSGADAAAGWGSSGEGAVMALGERYLVEVDSHHCYQKLLNNDQVAHHSFTTFVGPCAKVTRHQNSDFMSGWEVVFDLF